ncbi:c-type cytochrome [Rathayibacter toxicus]|uniref:Cytochrome bc1 complex cytochrome c subunit n=1 Tax=Rathayibacter toxicus TaxID=145458 RepID=A0A0C5B9J8_9MICO|nr:c-type cytochrome [Rathayibacter toxicus]AJM77493.1 cystathionine beta-lyase [Rathayibacter toxicus]ALS56597.1 cystathionine beta-lyase [Rathayibacter toxicus]KKM44689.1 cystathionine beta-lyase [Rathayibacter toxicus]PPG21575.1 cystathionine beta-lyase [Rathayibacter toxicus]PPG46539.1 cystathionine beta-lyase [Rathayibacter toxicus]
MASPKSKRRVKKGRRHPLATLALITIGLGITGGTYAAIGVATSASAETSPTSQQTIGEGKKVFSANCATCHGLDAAGTKNGPSLIGVGAAAVDFQVGTGRMPLQMQGPQALEKPVQFTDEQISQLAAYVASLSPGPAIPEGKVLDGKGDTANGAEKLRVNCAMCHNVAGAGGALTEGKFAPPLHNVSAAHIYEAMVTGPQNMPVFNDLNISPEDKRDIISYLKYIEANPSPGGFELGSLGPVAEGLFLWIFGLGAIVALTVWITARSN